MLHVKSHILITAHSYYSISERLCRVDAMRNSRRRFLICNQGDLFSLRNKSPCENMLSSIFFTFSSFRRHFNAGGIASQILFGSAIKCDFVTPAAQSDMRKSLIYGFSHLPPFLSDLSAARCHRRLRQQFHTVCIRYGTRTFFF